jgi:expansin (peptidoglycan-binding protein)
MPSDCSVAPPVVTGHATFYTPTGTVGACNYDYTGFPYFGAMNEDDYRASAACGTCARINYQGKTLDVVIVDECPYAGNEKWCYAGGHHIDLGEEAFKQFADPIQGVLDPMTWSYVACQVQGGITYTFKPESSQWWAEVLVGNFPYEITKFEYMDGSGNFVEAQRQTYNYFQASGGMGPGPFTFRVTDIHGSTVTDQGVALTPGQTAQGAANFGLCQ